MNSKEIEKLADEFLMGGFRYLFRQGWTFDEIIEQCRFEGGWDKITKHETT